MDWLVLAAMLAVAGGCAGEDEADIEPVLEEPATAPVQQPAAPADAGVVLRVDTLQGAGPYLTDGTGRALYMFTADTKGASESACHEACAEAWPPLLAPQGSPSAGAEPVRSDLIGTIQRADGTTQVTYGGWPLYYYHQDTGPGMTTGQDVESHGGEWYLVQPSGEMLHGEGHEGHS